MASSAPQQKWTDEKSSSAPEPPLTYQDYPHPNYPNNDPAYPPQSFPPDYTATQQLYPINQQPQGQVFTNAVQPIVYVTQDPAVEAPKNYLGYSFFTFLCCPPLGFVALIFSALTYEANQSRHQVKAQHRSRTALTLNHVAVGVGVTFYIILIIIIVTGQFHV